MWSWSKLWKIDFHYFQHRQIVAYRGCLSHWRLFIAVPSNVFDRDGVSAIEAVMKTEYLCKNEERKLTVRTYGFVIFIRIFENRSWENVFFNIFRQPKLKREYLCVNLSMLWREVTQKAPWTSLTSTWTVSWLCWPPKQFYVLHSLCSCNEIEIQSAKLSEKHLSVPQICQRLTLRSWQLTKRVLSFWCRRKTPLLHGTPILATPVRCISYWVVWKSFWFLKEIQQACRLFCIKKRYTTC